MNARRRLLTAAPLAGALLALTACEKPAPIVTVVNEGKSTYAEAGTWCFEGQSGESCSRRAESPTQLRVRGGKLGVDVDKELADGGWQVQLIDAAQPDRPLLTSEPQKENHYYAFDLPELPRGTRLQLTVQALTEQGQPGRGSWQFELVPRTEPR